MTSMTPYAAAKIANAALESAGVEKVLPPQMFYTYAKKDYIANVTVDGKKRITEEGLAKWLEGYVAKHTKATVTDTVEVDEDQLQLDLA
jgi:hypothetical protein